ncbi:MAG: DUF721 domain-containing protein [bacterium]
MRNNADADLIPYSVASIPPKEKHAKEGGYNASSSFSLLKYSNGIQNTPARRRFSGGVDGRQLIMEFMMAELDGIKELVEKTINKLSTNKKLKIALLWDREFKNYAKHTQLVDLSKGELKIQVDSAVWMQQLKLDKRDIITKLNKYLGAQTIKDIHFSIGEINHS